MPWFRSLRFRRIVLETLRVDSSPVRVFVEASATALSDRRIEVKPHVAGFFPSIFTARLNPHVHPASAVSRVSPDDGDR